MEGGGDQKWWAWGRGLAHLKRYRGEWRRGDGETVWKWVEHHLSCVSETGRMTTWESLTLPISLKLPVAGLSLLPVPLSLHLRLAIAVSLLILQNHCMKGKLTKQGNILLQQIQKNVFFLSQLSFCTFEVSFNSPWLIIHPVQTFSCYTYKRE